MTKRLLARDRKEERRKYYLKHREYILNHNKANRQIDKESKAKKKSNYYFANKDAHRGAQLQRNYNITLDEYEDMYIAVSGHCQICNCHRDVLFVDHDHATGEVRGLLCSRCNGGIGFLGDSRDRLRQALVYMQ